MEVIEAGGNALDAVELGCKIEEANEKGQSVGKGGLPDREGNVTLMLVSWINMEIVELLYILKI